MDDPVIEDDMEVDMEVDFVDLLDLVDLVDITDDVDVDFAALLWRGPVMSSSGASIGSSS